MNDLITVGEAARLADDNYTRTRARLDREILLYISQMIREAAENGERWINYQIPVTASRVTRTAIEETFREKGFAVVTSLHPNSVVIKWDFEPGQQ